MSPAASQAKPPREARTLQGGHDPREMGRRGGKARMHTMTAEQRSEVARQGALALYIKHKKQLLSLVGPALDGLQEALNLARPSAPTKDNPTGNPGDPTALIKVVTAILDRTGFHGKSGIELEGDLSHSHSGEIVHRHQLLDPDRLPLILRRMMAASIESDWSPSEELEMMIKSELPMLQVKVESNVSKETKR